MTIILVLDDTQLNYELLSTTGMVGRDLRKRGTRVLTAARRDVGVDTGLLRSSLHTRMSPGVLGPSVAIGSDVPYALMHHQGTRPHPIRARQGRVLSFTRGGARIYRSQVMHPGTKENPYLTSNLFRAVL
jgi:hypothetical protein